MAANNIRIDFLGIGAQRTASSWLWHNLRQHPEIWLPPCKELHYFDRSLKYASPSFLASDNPLLRFLGRQNHNRQFRKYFLESMAKTVKAMPINWRDLRWYLKYYIGRCSDNWYRSLFTGTSENIVKGEITPAYSILNRNDIQNIKNLFPDLKIIFIMRNPIDRTWSQLCYAKTRNPHIAFSINNCGILKKRIDGINVSLRSDYIRTLENWRSCFPEAQIFIGYYDEVIANPREFLKKIFSFLAVDEFHAVSCFIERVNVSKSYDMPEEIKTYLAMKYLEMLRELSRQFGGFATEWLFEAEKICDGK